MKIRGKLICLVSGVLLSVCTICGIFAVNQYMNVSVEKLAATEWEKLELAERAFSQVGTREDFDQMGKLARDAYLTYQFERCYQEGYALLEGQQCIKNMTGYEISAQDFPGESYVVQKLGKAYLLIMKKELPYPQGFWVMSVKNITSVWEEGKEQAILYFAVFTFIFAISMIIVTIVIRHILKALEQLKAQSERIKEGDFDSNVTLTSNDELRELSDSLNSMSDRIKQQIEDLELLLGAIAHEMKTPVTSIMGYTDSLLHVRLNERQKEQSLEAVYRSADRLNRISGKLLQLIGLYENQELEYRQVDLIDVFDCVYEEYKESLNENGICLKLYLETGEEVPCGKTAQAQAETNKIVEQPVTMYVLGDSILLISLFGNLISNSIKASASAGSIVVTMDREKMAICIKDNGRGIPAADLPHVTKAFYMVDKSRSRKQQSSGLGLALAERIVKAHHAKMTIKSQAGEGTEITIAF